MLVYKCEKCGVVTPLVDGNNKPLARDRKCFHCGSKEKAKIQLPNFSTKKEKRKRFGGGRITHIGL